MSSEDKSSAHRTALVDAQGRTMTFGQLKVSRELLASILFRFQIGGGCRVAILLDKSFASAISIYTCVDISAAYIPIDVRLPKSRIDSILADCNPHLVIHNQQQFFPGNELHPCNIPGMEGTYVTVLLTPNYREVESSKAAPNFFNEHISHILYTSGSTGIPKGVVVPFEATKAFVIWASNSFGIRDSDQVASIAPFHFDLSVLDLMVARYKRATLHLFNAEQVQNPRLMSEELAKRKITTIYATPTFFSALVEFGKPEKQDWSHLRTVLFAGEVFPVKQLHALMSIWNRIKFYNLYGPTETNVCTFTEIHRDGNRTEPYPIGKPCSGHEYELTTEGELLIGGSHVATGYLNRAELTQEKFFTRNNKRWFRTGDCVDIDKHGDLIYKGRLDRMVKRRGYRIEPGEIENALHKISGVTGATVIPLNGNEMLQLIAVITTDHSRTIDIVSLKSELLQILPDYMLPDAVVIVKEFPKTSSGKIDYMKLQQEVVSSLLK